MENRWARLLWRMERLASCKVNDVVKLAFPGGGQLREIDGLDLGMLKEFKRSGNSVVELKLVDRVAMLERLVELSSNREDGAEELLWALRGSADAVQGLFPAIEACAHLVVFR